MENNVRERERELNFDDSSPQAPGSGRGIWYLSLVFIVLLAGAVVFTKEYYQNKFYSDHRDALKAYYTPEMITTVLSQADREETGLRSRFLGQEEFRQPDLMKVYLAIVHYEPLPRKERNDEWQKAREHLLLAQQAEAEINYRNALYHYRQAQHFRPGSRGIAASIGRVSRIVKTAYTRENLYFLRSYDRVKAGIAEKIDYFRYLYNKELDVLPLTTGDVVVAAVIGPDGRVTGTRVVASDLRDDRFSRALVQNLGYLTFRQVDEDQKKLQVVIRFSLGGRDKLGIHFDDDRLSWI